MEKRTKNLKDTVSITQAFVIGKGKILEDFPDDPIEEEMKEEVKEALVKL